MTSSNVAHRIRRIAAALLLAPLAVCAAHAGVAQAPASQQQQAAPRTDAAALDAAPPAPAVEPAATVSARAAPTPAPAQRPPQVVMPTPSAPAAGSLLQTILALLLVLGLLLGLAWFMKRFGAGVMGASANLKLVGALNIGGRERIMVVEVGNQWIVVGASPGRVNALATMPRQEGAQVDGATLEPHGTSAGSFGDWLKNTIDKRNAK
ncbi:flagellar biosynthetic protein FliO [Massilia varians]|uniref:flagellar biosynthetic protein FliO n=1 Tax=Massilia varians TaxID=457921 RepID=UPI002555A5AE|nr:flagellar biosynthetic protein FliO [Massilia varians]MDK6079331.1 flagellar biosynthetic protein FliO [Massilia varians]